VKGENKKRDTYTAEFDQTIEARSPAIDGSHRKRVTCTTFLGYKIFKKISNRHAFFLFFIKYVCPDVVNKRALKTKIHNKRYNNVCLRETILFENVKFT
jgi:hypothetical protein